MLRQTSGFYMPAQDLVEVTAAGASSVVPQAAIKCADSPLFVGDYGEATLPGMGNAAPTARISL